MAAAVEAMLVVTGMMAVMAVMAVMGWKAAPMEVVELKAAPLVVVGLKAAVLLAEATGRAPTRSQQRAALPVALSKQRLSNRGIPVEPAHEKGRRVL